MKNFCVSMKFPSLKALQTASLTAGETLMNGTVTCSWYRTHIFCQTPQTDICERDMDRLQGEGRHTALFKCSPVMDFEKTWLLQDSEALSEDLLLCVCAHVLLLISQPVSHQRITLLISWVGEFGSLTRSWLSLGDGYKKRGWLTDRTSYLNLYSAGC